MSSAKYRENDNEHSSVVILAVMSLLEAKQIIYIINSLRP